MKRYSTSLIIKEMQTKTTMRYHFTTVGIAILKMTKDSKRWQGCREKEISVHCLEYTLVQPLWKTAWIHLKKIIIELPYDPAIPPLHTHTKKTKTVT